MEQKSENQGKFRQQAYLRAPIEIARKYKLNGLEELVHAIMWDCAGDWELVEAFFVAPNLQRGGGWAPVWAFMIERREYFDALFIETVKLYLHYRNRVAGARA